MKELSIDEKICVCGGCDVKTRVLASCILFGAGITAAGISVWLTENDNFSLAWGIFFPSMFVGPGIMLASTALLCRHHGNCVDCGSSSTSYITIGD